MHRLIAAAALLTLAGCVHPLHKPRCADPVKEWQEPELIAMPTPGRRIGGLMAPRVHWQWTEGHWHYRCADG